MHPRTNPASLMLWSVALLGIFRLEGEKLLLTGRKRGWTTGGGGGGCGGRDGEAVIAEAKDGYTKRDKGGEGSRESVYWDEEEEVCAVRRE